MKEPLISIIMPVYNAEKRLTISIKSILNQSYKNLELILINDGSTDASKEICQLFAESDTRVKVINQKNSGVSIARNRGIDESTGTYISFIDSDDFIEENAYEFVMGEFIEKQVDVIMFGMSFDYYNRDKFVESRDMSIDKPLYIKKQNIEKTFFDLYEKNYLSSVWNKVIKSSIIKENNIRFDKDMAILEDFAYVLEILSYTHDLVALNQVFYRYYNDVTTATLGRRPNINYWLNFRILESKLKEFSEKYSLNDSENESKINCIILRSYITYLEIIYYNRGSRKDKLEKLKCFLNDEHVIMASQKAICKRTRLMFINFLIKKQKLRLLDLLFYFNNLHKNIKLKVIR